MQAFLSFRRMVLPFIIEVLWGICFVICIVAGAVLLVIGIVDHNRSLALSALAVLIAGPLVTRIYCEMLIVVFRINETLTDVRQLLFARDRSSDPA